jgi:hypothetical protein
VSGSWAKLQAPCCLLLARCSELCSRLNFSSLLLGAVYFGGGWKVKNYSPCVQSSIFSPRIRRKSERLRDRRVASRDRAIAAIFKSMEPRRMRDLRSCSNRSAAELSKGSTGTCAKKESSAWSRRYPAISCSIFLECPITASQPRICSSTLTMVVHTSAGGVRRSLAVRKEKVG